MGKAQEMLVSYLKWRRSHTPDYPRTYPHTSVANEIATGKAFFGPADRFGRPCAVVQSKLHFKRDSKETERFIVYMLDQVR